ncbi:MAG: hypothetical protein WD512_10010 [Candidatus Paceibacterota bacterium]
MDFTYIAHPPVIEHIQIIYNQCRKNMMKVEQNIMDRMESLEKKLSK